MKLVQTFVTWTDSLVTSNRAALGYVISRLEQYERTAHPCIPSSNRLSHAKQQTRTIMSSQSGNLRELDKCSPVQQH